MPFVTVPNLARAGYLAKPQAVELSEDKYACLLHCRLLPSLFGVFLDRERMV
jgi:hypothetical protein